MLSPLEVPNFTVFWFVFMRNAGLDEAQAGIKITGRNINNLRYSKHWKHLNTQKIIELLFLKVCYYGYCFCFCFYLVWLSNYRITEGKFIIVQDTCQWNDHQLSDWRTSLKAHWLRFHSSIPGVQVHSLMGKLRSHMPHNQKTRT